jgi:hypothetical protein
MDPLRFPRGLCGRPVRCYATTGFQIGEVAINACRGRATVGCKCADREHPLWQLSSRVVVMVREP